MKKILMMLFITLFSMNALASDYCNGFRQGYKSVKPYAVVPVCPIQPIARYGTSPFVEGVRAGVRAAQSRGVY